MPKPKPKKLAYCGNKCANKFLCPECDAMVNDDEAKCYHCGYVFGPGYNDIRDDRDKCRKCQAPNQLFDIFECNICDFCRKGGERMFCECGTLMRSEGEDWVCGKCQNRIPKKAVKPREPIKVTKSEPVQKKPKKKYQKKKIVKSSGEDVDEAFDQIEKAGLIDEIKEEEDA